jgi:hypothetical protein
MTIETEKAIFADIYRFYIKHRGNTDAAQWEDAAHELAEIDQRHKELLCTNMLVAVWSSFFNECGLVKGAKSQ